MNVQNKTLRILGTIGGVVFSIALIVTLICSLIFSVSVSLIKPETIVTLAKEYDIVEQMLGDDSVNQALTQEGVPTELVSELLDSPFFEETIEAYTEEVIAAIQGKETAAPFNEDTVKQFAADNMSSLVALVKKYTPADAQISDEEIETALVELTDQYAETIVQAMPTGEQVKEMLVESEIQKPAELLVSNTVPIALYTVVGVLAAIIFGCLLHKFRGLLCLGIDALIAALILFTPYLVLSNSELIGTMLGESAELATPLITVLSTKLGVYLIVLTIVGVLFIAGFITYRVLAKKKTAAAVATIDAVEVIEATETVGEVPTEETENAEPIPVEEI